MHNITLFDAQVNTNYTIVGFLESENFHVKPFNNIGLYIGKQFYLNDIKYHKQSFFLIIDGVEYAIRGQDTKYIYVKETHSNVTRN